MTEHKYFAIKHKQTGKLMPTMPRNKATAWAPAGDNAEIESPRLFVARGYAKLALCKWEEANGKDQLVIVRVIVSTNVLARDNK